MSTGRQVMQDLLDSIADTKNAGSELSEKLNEFIRQRSLLAELTNSSVDVAIQEYITATMSISFDAIQAIETSLKNAENVRKMADDLKNDVQFSALMTELEVETAAEAKSSPYNFLKALEVQIAKDYQSCSRAVDTLTVLLKDLTVINSAKDKFVKMVYNFNYGSNITEESKKLLGLSNADDNFQLALRELFDHAVSVFSIGHENVSHAHSFAAGGALVAIGIAMVAVAVAIACPPAGALAFGLMIGGGISIFAGGITMFQSKCAANKANDMTMQAKENDPMMKIGIAMQNEERQIRSLRS